MAWDQKLAKRRAKASRRLRRALLRKNIDAVILGVHNLEGLKLLYKGVFRPKGERQHGLAQ